MDADYPGYGVLIPRRNTHFAPDSAVVPEIAIELVALSVYDALAPALTAIMSAGAAP